MAGWAQVGPRGVEAGVRRGESVSGGAVRKGGTNRSSRCILPHL